jgi:hypothetical protein
MQNGHLTDNEIYLLSNAELRGDSLTDALLHIELCEICDAKLSAPSSNQIYNAVFVESDKPIESAEKTVIPPKLNWAFTFGGLAMALLAIFAGIWFWQTRVNKPDEIVRGNTNQPFSTPSPANTTSNTVVSSNSNEPNNSNPVITPKSKPQEILVAKDTPKKVDEKPSQIVETPIPNEQSELEKYLVKVPATIVQREFRFAETAKKIKIRLFRLTPRARLSSKIRRN